MVQVGVGTLDSKPPPNPLNDDQRSPGPRRPVPPRRPAPTHPVPPNTGYPARPRRPAAGEDGGRRGPAEARPVHRCATHRPCLERALVLKAVDVPFQLLRVPAGWELRVPEPDADRAQQELAQWERENLHWPPPKVQWTPRSAGWTGALVYAIVIMGFHLLQRLPAGLFSSAGTVGGSVEWRRALLHNGRGDAARLLDGEWWRAVTGLCLHGDLPHLIGNLVFGLLFGVLSAQALGSGLAWFAILLAGVLGNLANSLIHELWVSGPTHLSIGASTAVFGAVGLLTGFTRRRGIGTAATRWGPVLAGLVLLGYLGMEGQNTDVLAHVTGFAAGILIGSLIAGPVLGALLERHQRLWGALALGLPAVAWLRAVVQ